MISEGSLVSEGTPDVASAGRPAAELFAQLNEALDRELPAAVKLRHELHAFPCLSGQEQPAADKLGAFLGLPTTTVASTGFYLRTGPADGPSIAVRTELDGLPLTEENKVPFASVNGAMHACGHDVHQAAFAAFVRAAAKVELPFALTAIAQPREETYPSGALDVIKDGVLAREDVASVLAVHVHPGIPEGAVATGSGAINAAADEFEIVVRGRGGHGAYPHSSVDPVPVAARICLSAYDLIRNTVSPVSPAALTVGELKTGTASNVIPDHALIRGTLRTMDKHEQLLLHAALRRCAEHTAQAFGATAEVSITVGEPVLRNDGALSARAEPWLGRQGLASAEPLRSCGADDFSFFTEAVPGVMAFLGVRSPEPAPQSPLHSATFLPPDSAVEDCARTLIALYVAAVQELTGGS